MRGGAHGGEQAVQHVVGSQHPLFGPFFFSPAQLAGKNSLACPFHGTFKLLWTAPFSTLTLHPCIALLMVSFSCIEFCCGTLEPHPCRRKFQRADELLRYKSELFPQPEVAAPYSAVTYSPCTGSSSVLCCIACVSFDQLFFCPTAAVRFLCSLSREATHVHALAPPYLPHAGGKLRMCRPPASVAPTMM